MTDDRTLSLEGFLAKMTEDTDQLLKALDGLSKSTKQLKGIAQEGNLHDLASTLEQFKKTFGVLKQEIEHRQASWSFDFERYCSSKRFYEELKQMATAVGLSLQEKDSKWYCYPMIISVLPKDAVVRIDRKIEKRLRPSYLAKTLKEISKKPVRSKPQDFLEALFFAYLRLASLAEKDLTGPGPVMPLTAIYELFTLLPGLPSEYTLNEFGRDIFVLDRNHMQKTKKGFILDLPASTALKSTQGLISAITPEGEEKRYYGVRFMPAERVGTI